MLISQNCRIVQGAKRGAIYNLENGNVYSLNEHAMEIVLGGKENDRFWEKLQDMGLAETAHTDGKGEISDSTFKFNNTEMGLSFMWLELTENCNLQCVHCYSSSAPQQIRYNLGIENWKSIIREGAYLGCERLQLTGGEAFTYKGVLDLASFAQNMGFSFVEIFTNAALLTIVKARMIKELGLHVAVSLYSCDPVVHEQITQIDGSFNKTYIGLKLLREYNIPSRVAIIAMKQNEHTIPETLDFIQELELGGGKVDVIRPIGRGSLDLQPTESTMAEWGLITKPIFRINKEEFFKNHYWNSCWAGKITVTNSGDILPCIFARNHVVGNVFDSTLEEIVYNESLKKLWGISKDVIENCKDCEYRYACTDCRPLSEAQTGKLFARNPRCTYNPYSGFWGK